MNGNYKRHNAFFLGTNGSFSRFAAIAMHLQRTTAFRPKP